MTPDRMAAAARRFAGLWDRFALAGPPDGPWNTLASRHADPPRAYHNLDHVIACLNHLDAVRELARNPEAVETALWFHDAVYDSRAGDNEERSAELAVGTLAAARADRTFTESVRRLILSTKHDRAAADTDESLICDIDLSILAAPELEFDGYERAIREEYAWVEPAAFAAGRAAVLRGFLARPAIYQTPALAAAWERSARENLARSLARL